DNAGVQGNEKRAQFAGELAIDRTPAWSGPRPVRSTPRRTWRGSRCPRGGGVCGADVAPVFDGTVVYADPGFLRPRAYRDVVGVEADRLAHFRNAGGRAASGRGGSILPCNAAAAVRGTDCGRATFPGVCNAESRRRGVHSARLFGRSEQRACLLPRK